MLNYYEDIMDDTDISDDENDNEELELGKRGGIISMTRLKKHFALP
jgi:hypothetical protein